jgi:hypothetical protein
MTLKRAQYMLALLGPVLLPFFVIGGCLFVSGLPGGFAAAQIIPQGRLQAGGAHFGLGQSGFRDFGRIRHKKKPLGLWREALGLRNPGNKCKCRYFSLCLFTNFGYSRRLGQVYCSGPR